MINQKKTFINPHGIAAKIKSLTKVLDAKFLHSLVNESKYNRNSTKSLILKTINGLF